MLWVIRWVQGVSLLGSRCFGNWIISWFCLGCLGNLMLMYGSLFCRCWFIGQLSLCMKVRWFDFLVFSGVLLRFFRCGLISVIQVFFFVDSFLWKCLVFVVFLLCQVFFVCCVQFVRQLWLVGVRKQVLCFIDRFQVQISQVSSRQKLICSSVSFYNSGCLCIRGVLFLLVGSFGCVLFGFVGDGW